MSSSASPPLTRARVFQVAWPIIVSNIAGPTLGLVDTAVIGRTGDAAAIGGLAIGAMIFSFLYWGFGFLRMGTTGLVSQADGAGDNEEVTLTVVRALIIGISVGLVLILLQLPVGSLSFTLTQGSAAAEAHASTYYAIRIWGAPASIAILGIMGYFLGVQQTKTALLLAAFLNTLNIILDVTFVMVLGWGIAGVATGTVIAEVTTIALGGFLVLRSLRKRQPDFQLSMIDPVRLRSRAALIKTFAVNRDIMIRTLCLIFAFAWFTNAGARQGDDVLAANYILMQMVTFAAFFLDGFALAGESMVGGAIGAKDRRGFDKAVRFSTELAFATSLFLSIVFFIAGPSIIDLLSDVESVRPVAIAFLPWAILSPIVAVWCYQLDGIFIGATRTVAMRNAMIASLAIYLAAAWGLMPLLGNNGLWAAMFIFFIARAVTLLVAYPALARSVSD